MPDLPTWRSLSLGNRSIKWNLNYNTVSDMSSSNVIKLHPKHPLYTLYPETCRSSKPPKSPTPPWKIFVTVLVTILWTGTFPLIDNCRKIWMLHLSRICLLFWDWFLSEATLFQSLLKIFVFYEIDKRVNCTVKKYHKTVKLK